MHNTQIQENLGYRDTKEEGAQESRLETKRSLGDFREDHLRSGEYKPHCPSLGTSGPTVDEGIQRHIPLLSYRRTPAPDLPKGSAETSVETAPQFKFALCPVHFLNFLQVLFPALPDRPPTCRSPSPWKVYFPEI